MSSAGDNCSVSVMCKLTSTLRLKYRVMNLKQCLFPILGLALWSERRISLRAVFYDFGAIFTGSWEYFSVD